MRLPAFRDRRVVIFAAAQGLLAWGYNGAEQHLTAFYQNLGKTNLGFNTLAVLYVAIVIGNLVGPFAARKIGIKLSLILGFASYSLFIFGLLGKLPPLIYTLSVILGVGVGVSSIAEVDWLRIVAPPAKRGEYAGTVHSVRTLGGFLGIISMSWLLRLVAVETGFGILGVVTVISVLLLFLMRLKKQAGREAIEGEAGSMWKMLGNGRIWWLLPKSALGGFLLGLVLGAVPTVIEKQFGIGWVGTITAIFHLTLALGFLVGGKMADTMGRFWPNYLAITISVVAALLFLGAGNYLSVLALVMLLLGIGGSIGGAASAALLLDMFEAKSKEAAAVLGNFGLVLGVIPSFVLPRFLSQQYLFYLGMILAGVSLVTLRIFERKYGFKQVQ